MSYRNAFAGFSVTGAQIDGSQIRTNHNADKDKLLNNQLLMCELVAGVGFEPTTFGL